MIQKFGHLDPELQSTVEIISLGQGVLRAIKGTKRAILDV
jgi:hypothetical protein